MSFVSELRYPTTWSAKLITTLLTLVLFGLLAMAAIAGFLLYRIVWPSHIGSDFQVGELLGRPSVVRFVVPGGGEREGWFFPGLKQAPTILLCHGYESSRGQILTMVSALQEHQYNVLLFDFSGHGKNGGPTTLGYRETGELLAAIDAVARRDDVDRTHFGVWGADLGGYAAIAAAAADARIRAVVADSVYNVPSQMLGVEVARSGLAGLPLVRGLTLLGFRLMNFSYRHEVPLSDRLSRLAGVAKLFIERRQNPVLAASTRQLFLASPEPRQLWVNEKGNYAEMMNEDKRDYENHVVNFFLQTLPPRGPSR